MIYENVILGLAARVRPKRYLLVPRGVQFYGEIFVCAKRKKRSVAMGIIRWFAAWVALRAPSPLPKWSHSTIIWNQN